MASTQVGKATIKINGVEVLDFTEAEFTVESDFAGYESARVAMDGIAEVTVRLVECKGARQFIRKAMVAWRKEHRPDKRQRRKIRRLRRRMGR